jgi:hypothetical protein
MRCAKVVFVASLVLALSSASSLAQAAPESSPAELMKSFHTIQVRTGTWLSKPEMMSGALQKYPEFNQWGLAVVSGRNADVVLAIDHQPGWFYYTYSLTHVDTRVVLASGKVDAWDGNAACKAIAKEIIKEIKRVRPVPKT